MLSLVLWSSFIISSYLIPWQTVFNTNSITKNSLGETVRIASFFMILNFWIGLITAIIGAIQKTSLIVLGQLISNTLILTSVYLLTKTTNASISLLAFAYGISIVTPNVILSWWFFQRNKALRPRVRLRTHHIKPLLTVGVQFFTIQLAALIIFTTDKLLITQLFGPEYVTNYEITSKLFGLILIAHGLIMAPLWSAYTEAYHKADFRWMKRMINKQLKIFIAVIFSTFVLGLLSRDVIRLWIGADIHIESNIVIAMTIFVIVSTWNNIFAMFVNGLGMIRLQLITAIFAMILNIPISIFYAKYLGLGVSGIVLGTTTSLLLAAIALPIQVYWILRQENKDYPHE